MVAVAKGARDPRTRILDAALELMGEQGAAGASMRQLASACDLNVATIYHYFPSKADLLRSVMEERRYGERLRSELPPIDASAPPRERLAGLLGWLWESARAEEQVLRLLVGEAIRGEAGASSGLREVVEVLELTLAGWLADHFPEVTADAAALSRVLSGQIFSFAVEQLALGGITDEVARARTVELVDLVLPA